MDTQMAYGILVFYGLLSILTAFVGGKMDNKNGFSYGYVVGNIISIILWFTVGKQYAKA
jgi:hypothetical protein